jgi:hypothetical protein
MSKLNFASVGEAFKLGSEQIKNTQEEIAKLKALVMDSSGIIKPPTDKLPQTNGYERIGPPDIVNTNFVAPSPQRTNEEFEYTLMNLMKNPKFDDIVKNYVTIKHPEWLLSSTNYAPQPVTPQPVLPPPVPEPNFSGFQSISTFGNSEEIYRNIIIFFVISVLFYLMISKLTS